MRAIGTTGLLTLALGYSAPLAAQQPAASWQLSVDGRAFGQYMQSGTRRGAQQFGSANWLMLEVGRESVRHSITSGAMVSLEPITLGECGYPRLLTPEFLCDDALEDREHAHPLVMALAARYRYAPGDLVSTMLHAALVGEPAFGPAPYFHRASAQNDPITPLSNDLLNPAHVSYGLLTWGLAVGRFAGELSAFNGTGRDRNPWDFDVAPMHSYAARLSAGVTPTWRTQVSVADFQASGGVSHHGSALGRMRAWSASLERTPEDPQRGTAITLAWTAHHSDGETVHAGLLEAQFTRGRNSIFGRAERVGRVEKEMNFIYFEDGTHEHFEVPRRYRIRELSTGYLHNFGSWLGLDASLGARASMNTIPKYIQPRYHADLGFAFALFGKVAVARGSAHHH